MSSERSQSPPAQTEAAEIARLKRRLAASQEEVKELSQGKVKKTPYVITSPSFGLISFNKLSIGPLLHWDAAFDVWSLYMNLSMIFFRLPMIVKATKTTTENH